MALVVGAASVPAVGDPMTDHVNSLLNRSEVQWEGGNAPVSATPRLQPGDAAGLLDNAAHSDEPRARLRALEAMANGLPAQHLDIFVAALADPAPEVSLYAVQALRDIDPELLCGKLMELVSAANADTLGALKVSLPGLREPLEERLVELLKSDVEKLSDRTAAAFCLGAMGCAGAAQTLAQVAWGSDLTLSLACAQALAALPEPAVIAYLFDLAAHPAPEVRLEALRMLSGINGPEAIAALGRIAIERPANDAALSKLAVEAIAQLPDIKVSIPLLIETMRKNLAVRKTAGATLRHMTGQRFGDMPSEWQTWWSHRLYELENPPPPDEQAQISIGYG